MTSIQSNTAATERNADFMQGLAEKVEEQPAKYRPLKAQADQISVLANDFNAYIADLKGKMTASVDDPQDYETRWFDIPITWIDGRIKYVN